MIGKGIAIAGIWIAIGVIALAGVDSTSMSFIVVMAAAATFFTAWLF